MRQIQQKIKDRKKQITLQKEQLKKTQSETMHQLSIFQRLNLLDSTSISNWESRANNIIASYDSSSLSSKLQAYDLDSPGKSLEYSPNFSGRDINSLYKFLFENDLNSTK